jgi:hypothetical protein
LTPLQVYKLERLRKAPYSRMFGCSEREKIAQAIVEHLKDSDSWETQFDFYQATVMIEDLLWCDDHGHHGHEGTFQEEFIQDGRVNQRFIDYVTRRDDLSQFKPEVVDALSHIWDMLG